MSCNQIYKGNAWREITGYALRMTLKVRAMSAAWKHVVSFYLREVKVKAMGRGNVCCLTKVLNTTGQGNDDREVH